MKYLIIISLLVLPVLGIKEVAVIKEFSKHIGNVVLECKEEMGFGREMIKEFKLYWDKKHVLNNTNQGCVVACILKKLELTPGGVLRNDNADAFAKANGADAALTSKLKELYHLCSRAAITKNSKDGCGFALELAKCFRYGIFAMQWAPAHNVDYRDEPDDQIEVEAV